MAGSSSRDYQPMRIMLWCQPRTVSTAFTKFMTFVDDVEEIWFEPYVFSHINEKMTSILEERGAAMTEMVEAMFPAEDQRGKLRPLSSFSFTSTRNELEAPRKDYRGKFIFVKDMAWAIHGRYDCIPQKVPVKHVFLIRDPQRFIPSYLVHMERSGVPVKSWLLAHKEDQMLALWRYIRENVDLNPPVIDSDQLLQNPGTVLAKLFAELGMPWKDSYLEWSGGDEFLSRWIAPLEGVAMGSKVGTHTRAFSSTNFIKVDMSAPQRQELSGIAQDAVDIFLPGYREMMQHALH